MGVWGRMFGQVSRWWNRDRDSRREAQRELLAVAIMLGYNSTVGGLHLIDPLTRQQFWRRDESEVLHSSAMPGRPPPFLMPVIPGGQIQLDVPGHRTAQVVHRAFEEAAAGGSVWIEQVEVQGLFAHPFIYQRRLEPDGEVQGEARIGDRFHSVAAHPGALEHPYIRELRRLSASPAAPREL